MASLGSALNPPVGAVDTESKSGMDLRHIARETTKVLASYLTYQAVRTVNAQLRETNPGLSIWLTQFSANANLQDGEAYIKRLLQANAELAFRVMTVRQVLAQDIAEFLPEMVNEQIAQANIDHRCRHLEQITQFDRSSRSPGADGARSPDSIEPD